MKDDAGFKDLFHEPPLKQILIEDAVLGDQLVAHNLVSRAHVDECLALQKRLAEEAKVRPLPRLGKLLVKKGYLSRQDLDQSVTVRQSGPSKKSVLTQTQFDDLPPDVLEAGSNPANVFGRYIRSSMLGKGGMGEVWRAWDNELRRWVALKFLMLEDPEELARFQREAQTAGKLSHPNIASVYEIGQAHGKHFIAMQFVAGQTLASFPRDDVKLLVELIRDAAIALHAAHEEGVIHRDLKPENIMVEGTPGARPKTARHAPRQKRSKGLRLFVMDFGLAKNQNVEKSLSSSGTVVGTPAYMSPEQSKGSRDLDRRSDVYSLGATLYSILADRPPFKGKNIYDLLKKVVEEEPKRLRRIKPRLDEDLETIVMKCLEKDRARRYATALELADDLSRWLDGEAIEAHPPSALYRARKFAGKWKTVLLGIGTAGLLAIALMAGLLVPPWLRAKRDRATAEHERDSEQAKRREVELFAPIERDLAVLRMKFYQPDFKFTPEEFKKYELLERRVEVQMIETGRSAQGLWLIGQCREVSGNSASAEEAYDAALVLDAKHGPSLLAKGWLAIQRALRLWSNSRGEEERVRRSIEEAHSGAEYVRKGLKGVEEHGGMARDLASGYVAVLENWPNGKYRADEMLAKWAGAPFVEEFLLLEGMAGGPEKLTALSAKVVEKVPSWPVAYLARASSRFLDADFDGAIADLTKAIEINPRHAQAYASRGTARVFKGDHDGANSDFTTAIELIPAFAEAYLSRGGLSAFKGDLDGAIRDLTKAIEANPLLAEAYFGRGGMRAAKGEFDLAIADLTKAIELNPKYSKAYFQRGIARHAQGDGRGAISDLRKASEDPKFAESCVESLLISGGMFQAKGDIDSAIAQYSLAIEMCPTSAHAYFARGSALEEKGDHDRAILDLTRVIELDPKMAEAYFIRATARDAQGELDAAITDMTRAIELDPRNSDMYYIRGSWRDFKGDSDAAIADYTKAIEINPKIADAYCSRGAARLDKGDLDGSIADCTKAIEINPKLAMAYYSRGNARRAKGDLDGAIADLAKVLEIAPAAWPLRKEVERILRELKKQK